MQVEDGLVSRRQLPDQVRQFPGPQQHLRVIVRYRVQRIILERQLLLVYLVLFKVVECRSDDDHPYPRPQFSVEAELVQVLKNLDKTVL
jgi:hypothetical protein